MDYLHESLSVLTRSQLTIRPYPFTDAAIYTVSQKNFPPLNTP